MHEHTVLFVDDEVNILKALQRLWHYRRPEGAVAVGLQGPAACKVVTRRVVS